MEHGNKSMADQAVRVNSVEIVMEDKLKGLEESSNKEEVSIVMMAAQRRSLILGALYRLVMCRKWAWSVPHLGQL